MFTFSKNFYFFKRGLCLLITALMLILNGTGSSLDTDRAKLFSITGSKNTLLSVYSHCFYEPTVKLTSNMPMGNTKTHTMYMAKNETEFCQIAVRSTKSRKSSYVKVSDFTDKNGNVIPAELCFEYEVIAPDSYYSKEPDALLPATNNEWQYWSLQETNYVFAIIAKTDENTVPGDYTATVQYGNFHSDGSRYENSTAKVSLHVWDFTLPKTSSLKTAYGVWYNLFPQFFDGDSAEMKRLMEEYYEMFLEHHISLYHFPQEVFLSDEADKYLNDERMTSYIIPYSRDDATLQQIWAKVQSNPVWAEKGYFYPVDEPNKKDRIDAYIEATDRLERLCPGYKMLTPVCEDTTEAVNTQTGEHYSNIDLQIERNNTMCPVNFLFDTVEGLYDRCKTAQANGSEFWSYIVCGTEPTTDYCNYRIENLGIKMRILFWQMDFFGVEGLLFWSTNYSWQDRVDIYYNVQSSGGGYLVYPLSISKSGDIWWLHEQFGFHQGAFGFERYGEKNMIFSSLRLEGSANGIEDYEYLKMAEDLLGKDYADKTVRKITTGNTEFTYSDATFAKVRIELGNAIEKASK